MRFPLGGGINGLAAEQRVPVSTIDYLADPRIPQEPDDVAVAERLGLRGMAAAPLRAPGGDVIGTLAVSSATPRDFLAEELDLLQGLADQAAIAITNSTLLTRLSESEERYRFLVENAPDLVWSVGPDARLTFLSDAVERLTGHRPDELLGQHFGVLVHESSREVAELDWSAGMAAESQELRGRVNLRGPDGEPVPAEFIAVARLDEDGSFAGANGSVRDMRERDRLERELRESETRFRQLVQTTPDVIYRCDAEGRFLFMAEGSEALFGWKPSEVAGMTFADLTAEESLPLAIMNFESQREERDVVRRYRYMLKHHDGTVFPAAISSVSVWEDDKFAGVQGTVRGLSEQERLERELRESEERYRFLVENSPDVVFATDADGRFTFISEAIEAMTGYSPSEAVDQHFSMLVQPESMPIAADRWAKLVADPATQQVAELTLIGKDGRLTPVEVHTIGIAEPDGTFAGIHGAIPRHQRARATPARAARIRGALPLPRLVLAGPRLGHRRRRPPDLRQRFGRDDPRPDRRRADRSTVLGVLRPRGRARGQGPVQVAVAASDVGPADRASRSATPTATTCSSRSTASACSTAAASSGRTARPGTSATATASSATSGARPASSPQARSEPISPASSTTR